MFGNALCTGCVYKITHDYLFPENAKLSDHLEKCQGCVQYLSCCVGLRSSYANERLANLAAT